MQPDTTTSISDDQELAKVLAGVNGAADAASEESEEELEIATIPAPAPEPIAIDPLPVLTPTPTRDNLDGVKTEAINELRPLIDKLDLPVEEKFDTYLLLIRCTDDRDLVPPAHEVAKLIPDDSRRAMALLDIIKEIDYLANKSSAPEDLPTEAAPGEEAFAIPTPGF